MEADVEKRLEKIERLLLEEDRFTQFERKSVRFVALLLLLFALAALVIWGLVELIAFAIHRIQGLHL